LTAFRLQLLLDHARHRLEAAERLLRMLRRKQDAASQKLEELCRYREEYRLRYTGSGAKGMDIHMLRDYQMFMAKLDSAIRHQEQEVQLCRSNWQAGHDKWLGQRQKVQAYEALEMRHQLSENRRREKVEQRQSDEGSALRQFHQDLKPPF
jgi:flagellar FliJ protein